MQRDEKKRRESLPWELQFPKLGLADTSVQRLAAEYHLVLTDNFRMAGIMRKSGVGVINFNHLRSI